MKSLITAIRTKFILTLIRSLKIGRLNYKLGEVGMYDYISELSTEDLVDEIYKYEELSIALRKEFFKRDGIEVKVKIATTII